MFLSDVSVKRPVLAIVVSLLLVVLGLISFQQLPLREFPNIDPPIVSVDTTYRGASAAVVETRITQILENAVAGIEGIETLQSSSSNGRSSVTIEFSLNRDIEGATNDVRDAVNRVVSNLPDEADPPRVFKVDGDADAILWYNLASTRMDSLELTDYANRYIVDRLSTVDGVARVIVGGGQRYAMRIWLNREALAARGLTVSDVVSALRRENVELPAGSVESTERDFTVRVTRGYRTPADFSQLTISAGRDGHLIRLGEVAQVELGSEEPRTDFRGNGEPQIGLGIVKTSTSNTLDVARGVHAEMKRIQETLPAGTQAFASFDSSVFVDAAVNEVYFTLSVVLGLVLGVIYLFLGSFRAALIPAVTVPVCLIAAFFALNLFGFSLNLLTLLALVLAIGLVVDDAIVVLENCQRRVDNGEPPLIAAYRGTRQVAFAVIATTAVLVSVFLPIGFMEGNLGRLFRELGVAIASAVVISSIVALTLSPVMCSWLLRKNEGGGLTGFVDSVFSRLTRLYRRTLERTIDLAPLWAAVVVMAVGAVVWTLDKVPRELAPAEDRGAFFVMVNGPEGAGFDYTIRQMRQVEATVMKLVDEDLATRIMARAPRGWGGGADMHTGFAIVVMKPWNERDVDTFTVLERTRRELGEIPGVRAMPLMRQGLARGGGQPVQFVIGGPDYAQLVEWRDLMMARIESYPGIVGADNDYKETRPQLRVNIDRTRAAALGVSVQEIGSTLETMLGSRRATTFTSGGEEYDVILQARREDRLEPSDLTNLYVRSERSGELIPLTNLITLSEVAEPGSLGRFNRLRSITITGNLAPGYTLGEALTFLQTAAAEELPAIANIDYKGESREYILSGNTVLFTFGMAMLIVFLVLAAQFESFIHPFVIMLTVPLAVLGALIGLLVFGSTLNIYSQIGIIMLVGLAAKNGILIVEFANQIRDTGASVRDAIISASATRLRPIAMTSLSTVIGAVPLILASGAGSASRQTLGIVIFSGVLFATFLSLFVVPALYRLLAGYTRSPGAIGNKVDRFEAENPDPEAGRLPVVAG